MGRCMGNIKLVRTTKTEDKQDLIIYKGIKKHKIIYDGIKEE